MDKVVHFEIPSDNLDRAKKFYQGLFGWQLTDIPAMNDTIVQTVAVDEGNRPKKPGAINGGMMMRSHPGQQPVIVINVSSVDDSLKQVEEAGGKIVRPKMQVGEMGLYAR